jgi:hypothetical protein
MHPSSTISCSPGFEFYINIQNLPTTGIFRLPLTNGIFLRWSWNTCAGYPPPFNVRTTTKDGCVDDQNIPLTGFNLGSVFRSLEKFSLRRNFPGNPTYQEFPLADSLTGSIAAMGNLEEAMLRRLPPPLLTLNGTSRLAGGIQMNDLKSDYYAFVISATDTLGRVVSGQSQVFAIQGEDPLPSIREYLVFMSGN